MLSGNPALTKALVSAAQLEKLKDVEVSMLLWEIDGSQPLSQWRQKSLNLINRNWTKY
uniref:Uncharacterized protein n=1 Tax=Manihot esculenta TaxID=3983 RepID=A0A2C9UL73_MANES